MTNSEWGVKRTCPHCAMRFYDLNKNPAICPKCKHSFDPNQIVRTRRKAAKKVEEKKPAVKKADPRKKKSIEGVDLNEFDDAETIEGMGDIEEIEEMDEDDLDDLEVDADEEVHNDDDADDEAIIEGLEAEEGIVDRVDDMEEDAEEEEDEPSPSQRKKPQVKSRATKAAGKGALSKKKK